MCIGDETGQVEQDTGTPPATVALVLDYSLDYLGGAQSAFLDQISVLLAAGVRVLCVVPHEKSGMREIEFSANIPGNVSGNMPGNVLGNIPGMNVVERGAGEASCDPLRGGDRNFRHEKAARESGEKRTGGDSINEERTKQCSENRCGEEWENSKAPQDSHSLVTRVSLPYKRSLPGVNMPLIRNTPWLRKQLRQVFEREGVELVHVHSEFGVSAAACAAAKKLRLPVVCTVHTFFWQARVPCVFDRFIAAILRRSIRGIIGESVPEHALAPSKTDSVLRATTLLACQKADTVISPSAHQRALLVEALTNATKDTSAEKPAQSLPADSGQTHCIQGTSTAVKTQAREKPHVKIQTRPRTKVIPNPGRPLLVQAAPLTFPPNGTSALHLLWVGRVVAEKRPLLFIDAIAEASQKVELRVTLAGAGPLLRRAQHRARKLPITFLGRVDRQKIQELMRETDATVLSSYGFDNQPVTIVESICSYRPVILCDTNLREGLEGTGFYTRDESAHALAETIIDLARDREKLLRASKACVEQSRIFHPQTHAKALLDTYAELL